MTGDHPPPAPALGRIWQVAVSLRFSYRLAPAPVPNQDRGGTSPVDDGYHCPDEPQLGLQGQDAPAAVTSGVDGEQGDGDASGNCADRQAAHQACCQAASPRGRNWIIVALSDRGGGCKPGVDTRGYFVVDVRKE